MNLKNIGPFQCSNQEGVEHISYVEQVGALFSNDEKGPHQE